MTDGKKDLVIGRQPVLEILKQGRPEKILLVLNQRGAIIGSIFKLARDKNIPIEQLPKQKFEQTIGYLSGHQGVAALVTAFSYLSFEDLLNSIDCSKEMPSLILLDHLQDPQNLGAIIRTAHCAGMGAVIIPRRRSVQVTPTVRKVAAGAAEKIPVVLVNNLVQAIQRLKKEGFWIYGAEAEGSLLYCRADFRVPLALVLGSEGEGISPLVRRHCDRMLHIPMQERDGSLNVSAAAAVLIYTALCKRRGWLS